MKTITISGGSDDIISIEGDINEEFNPSNPDDNLRLGFSDGTVLLVYYDPDGIWRVKRLAHGTASYVKDDAGDADTDYSDRVTLTGDIEWVIGGEHFAR